jgi:hypothetical protein
MRTPRVIRKRVICFQGVASRLSCMRWSLRLILDAAGGSNLATLLSGQIS